MKQKLLIRDLTLRDGQQSLFATRMKQEDVDRVLPNFKKAGFYAMEVWGGAVPDSVMRYLNENPWTRLEKIKEGIGDVSKLTALSRGRNLFGYNPYPDETIEGFNRNAVKSGIDIMRIFDALNDVDNMKSTIKFVKENGGMADCVVCYTIDPKFTKRERWRAFYQQKRLPKDVFNTDYFVGKAKELQDLGADMITIKDMAGLIPPVESGELVRGFKEVLDIPLDFHTHCTPGYGLPAVLMAIINGVDIIDTALMPFAGGPAAPAFEVIKIFCDKLGIELGIDLDAVKELNADLLDIRKTKLDSFDSYKLYPTEIDIKDYRLPIEVDKLFDKAIEYARAGKENQLLHCTLKIENYFNFPPPNENVKNAEIPGGMYTNMLAQLRQLKLEKLLNRVLEVVPLVRVKAGCPPLVTPTSQIVGVQAVNCVIDENSGNDHYTNVSVQFNNLVKGLYGKTPIPVDPDFREQICGHRDEIPYNPKDYKKQEIPTLEDCGNIKVAENEKEELLLELFPSVAKNFLSTTKRNAFQEQEHQAIEAEQERIRKEKQAFDSLSEDQKKLRLLQGLYNYDWTSQGDEINHDHMTDSE